MSQPRVYPCVAKGLSFVTMAGTPTTTLSSRIAALLPARAVAAAVRTAYPRVEPELARLASYAPHCATAVDVGAWYGPWTRGLRRIADRSLEPQLAYATDEDAGFSRVQSSRAALADALVKYVEELLELRRAEVALDGLLVVEETIEAGTLRPPGSGRLDPPGEGLPNAPAGGGIPVGSP